MSDWIGLGVFLLAVAGAVAGLSFLGRKRPPMTNEEFERRAAEARGTTAGIAHALQKIYDPRAARAAEVQRELRGGRYDRQAGRGDDGPHDGTEGKNF